MYAQIRPQFMECGHLIEKYLICCVLFHALMPVVTEVTLCVCRRGLSACVEKF